MEQNEYLQVRTKGNANPQGKPRVYFTCHPADFDRSFGKLCEDIFATHDCAIYYTADMTALDDENRELDLSRMNLFVIPVSFRLLNTPNRAMDEDFPFAVAHHIPVFPILLETGLDALYSRRFGDLQYLDPLTQDATAIRYEEKLKKNLDSVLVDDETAKQVRAAFDAYIFLSYRKKDRQYANQLMRLIHSDPICRDIAIWYDEFLAPGENFNDVIGKALQNSDLFALLVTPNLVNEDNYVRKVEYPEAQKAGKPVLPAEMLPTDPAALREQFPGIAPCVNPNEPAFRERLLSALRGLALRENDTDPKHNFLIGLAYLDGIDVEKDLPRALSLITSAAESDLPEAMEKLRNMYHDGQGVTRDLRKALFWCERILAYCIRTFGEDHPNTITAIHNLATFHREAGNYREALRFSQTAYALCRKVLGEECPATLTILNTLASIYGNLGDHRQALEMKEKTYALCRRILGEEHPETLTALNDLGNTYGHLGDYPRAHGLHKKCYELRRSVSGEEHPDTLTVLGNLAGAYIRLGDPRRATELQETVYTLQCRVLGEDHPNTLIALNNLASYYGELGAYQKELTLLQKAYALQCETMGETHPVALATLANLACTYNELEDPRKALELLEKAYTLQRKALGEAHHETLATLSNLACTYSTLGDHKKALELHAQAHSLRREALGEKHPDTLTSMSGIAAELGALGDHQRSLKLKETVYALHREVLGEEHPDTLLTLNNLASAYLEQGDLQNAMALFEKAYASMRNVFGKNHPAAVDALLCLLVCCDRTGTYRGKLELFQAAYKICMEQYGPEVPLTVMAKCGMAFAHAAQGETEKALDLCGEVLQSGAGLTEDLIRKLADFYDRYGCEELAAQLRAYLEE